MSLDKCHYSWYNKKEFSINSVEERRLIRNYRIFSMKLVVLVDGSSDNFEDMIDIAKNNNKHPILIDTENCNETNEYRYLLNSIENFSHSNREVMLAKFSGKESITRNLGDERSEMIVTVSNKKSSKYYTECPTSLFLDMINILN